MPATPSARDALYDLAIIGGGVNGAGIARDAAGRGLTVLLVEKGDLAGATSSASTKLIHGGLRYLEYYEFRLVREALKERELLLRMAPHIIRPMQFVLPHDKTLRPAWMIRGGLFLYDHIGGRRTLPGSIGLDLRRHAGGAPLKPERRAGFLYSDCQVDDARLVILNALDAAERGADIRTRTTLLAARRSGDHWTLRLQARGVSDVAEVRARALVNAAGPWAGRLLGETIEAREPARLRLVKGSHIVVPRLSDGPYAYVLQGEDRRVVFAIPFEERFTLIGTTDESFAGDPDRVAIADHEIAYLCATVSRYFRVGPRPQDVVWTYAGVRPLQDDGASNASAVTRDYVLRLEAEGRPPLLSVFGGKITTYRRLAEHALGKLAPLLDSRRGDAAPSHGAARPWTATAPLPGGDIAGADFALFRNEFAARHAFLPAALAQRYARLYGTRAEALIGGAKDMAGLGEGLGDGVYEAELDYLVSREWAMSAQDILWRRTKLGLHAGEETVRRIEDWLARNASTPPAHGRAKP